MKKPAWILLAALAVALAFLALGYLYPVAAPDGWSEQRMEERIRDR